MYSDELLSALQDCFGTRRVLTDEPMALHTTFGTGGPVDAFFSPSSIEEVADAVAIARKTQAPLHVIGCGSNLLVSDDGLDGLCLHFGHEFSALEVSGTQLTAQSGATNKEVADFACASCLSGYEFACGIPGSIGGAAIMNAGAYDGEFADICSSVTCLTGECEVVTLSAEEAKWGYRRSLMMDKGWIVLSACLQLVPFDSDSIASRMAELTCRRQDKQPLEFGSAGSTFKRPIGHYAAKLIEDAGMRGHTVGGAMVSEKHCGFVINYDHATSCDVLTVIEDVSKTVFADSGVVLEPEVRLWGFD